MMSRLLFVDDDPRILTGLRREFENDFEVLTAQGGPAGLEVLGDDGPFELVMSDLRMPKMDGIEFLSQAREISPDTTRIMLTGNADLQAAMDAVNQGHIFRFLTKPCPPEVLRMTIVAGVEQHRLITAERELLENTLNRSIEVLSDILSLVNPLAFSRAERIRFLVRHIVTKLEIPNAWQYELAAMLSQIGCVTLPPDVLEKAFVNEELSEKDEAMYLSHPLVAGRLLSKIPRLELIAKMVAAQRTKPGGPQVLQLVETRPDVLGGQILRTASEYDRLLRTGRSAQSALVALLNSADGYDPDLIEALTGVEVQEAEYVTKSVQIEDLDTTMIIDDMVTTSDGRLLVAKDMPISYALLERLRNYGHNGLIHGSIKVRAPK